MNLEEAKRLSNVKVITAAYLLAGLTGQQELNPSRWPALVSHFIDEIKKRTGADWLSMPKGAYEKGDSVSRESITQSEFLQLLADYPVQSATAHPQAAAPAPVVADSASNGPGKSRRDLLAPAISAAQKLCEEPFDPPAVWAALVQMAQDGKRPLIGVTEDGIKWNDAEDNPQFLSLKNLRDRLARSKKQAL